MCLIEQCGTSARLFPNYRAFTTQSPSCFLPYLRNKARQYLHPANDYAITDPFCLDHLYKANQPSTFTCSSNSLNLPLLSMEENNPYGAARYELTEYNDQLVLVIDDEDDVRTVTVEVLQEAQLKTLQAANGPAGIALFRQHASQIKLVILDFFMPGMNGEQVLTKLRSIDPRIPVIFFSGFSEHEVMGRIQLRNGVTFLQKPYTINALWNIVQQHL